MNDSETERKISIMNTNLTKIKNTLESFFDYAVKSADECRSFHEKYKEDVALSMEAASKDRLRSAYQDDKEKIEQIVTGAIEAVRAADVFKGEDITRDAELLAKGYFDIGKSQFEFLVKRYAYKNNTMCALLRKYSDDHPELYLDTAPEIHAALAPADERIKTWEKIKAGALSLLETIYVEHATTYGKVHSQQKLHTMPVTQEQVKGFMEGQFARDLVMLIGE